MTVDPLVAVFRERLCNSWPKYAYGPAAMYMPLSQALTRRFRDCDAHVVGYSVPSIRRRLCTSPPAYERIEGGVPMLMSFWDIDCPKSHKATADAPVVRADDAWWADQRARFAEMVRVHPGGFFYRTLNGARAAYQRPAPFIVLSQLDALRWTRSYLLNMASLYRRFGIICDPTVGDWSRFFRLPHTLRNGVMQELETVGDPHAVSAFEYEPDEAADLDAARKMAELDARWIPKLRLLAQNYSTTRARTARAPKVVAPGPALPPGALEDLARDLGRALRNIPPGKHQVHLALAGASYERGVPLAAGPALARSIIAYSGETDDRPQVWDTTAQRIRDGLSVTGYGALASYWPTLAAVLDTAFPRDGGAKEVRAELDARGVPEEVSAVDAMPRIREAIRNAPPGLKALRTTEGAGKTLLASEVLRELALAADDRERIPSAMKAIYAAPTHAIAEEVSGRLTGTRAEYWRGVLAARRPDGSPACVYHPHVSAMVQSGHAARTWCDSPCPAREKCPARDEAIVPLGDGRSPAVIITVHALVREALAWGGESARLITDEDPQAYEAYTITRAELDAALAAMDLFSDGEQFRGPFVRALAAGIERGELVEGEALLEVLSRGCAALAGDAGWEGETASTNPTQLAEHYAIHAGWTERREPDGEMVWRRRAAWAPRPSRPERQKVFYGRADARLAPASKVHALLARMVAGIVKASPPNANPHAERAVSTVEVAERDPSRRVLRGVSASAAVASSVNRFASTLLLDATADGAPLGVLAGGPVPIEDIRVADGAPVTRRMLYWSNATRRNTLDGDVPRWNDGLARYLGLALDQAARFASEPRVAIFTWKPLAAVLRSGTDPVAEQLLAKVRGVRGVVLFGYYGNARGRNDWKNCDVLVSLGDPRPNLGASRAVAAAIGLARDHARIYRHIAAAEISQVGGRLRAPWRTKPALHIHVGTIPGLRWDARAEVLELPRGPAHALDPGDAAEAVLVHGSQRLAGASLGVSQSTVYRIARKPSDSTQSHGDPSVPNRDSTGTLASPCDCSESLTKSVPVNSASVLIDRFGGVPAVMAATGQSKPTVYHWRSGGRPMPREVRQQLEALLALRPVVAGSERLEGNAVVHNGSWQEKP